MMKMMTMKKFPDVTLAPNYILEIPMMNSLKDLINFRITMKFILIMRLNILFLEMTMAKILHRPTQY